MIKRLIKVLTILCVVIGGISIWIKFDRPIDTIVIEGDLTLAEQEAMQKQIAGLNPVSYTHLTLPTTPYV